MGVTSGASTPNKAVQNSLERIFLLKKVRGSVDEEGEYSVRGRVRGWDSGRT